MHPRASDGEQSIAKDKWEYMVELAGGLAKMLALWPSAKLQHGGKLERLPPELRAGRAPRPPPARPHKWMSIARATFCEVCLRSARGPPSKPRKADYEECPGACAHIAACVRAPGGHVLHAYSYQGVPGIICSVCGAFAGKKPSPHLAVQCLRSPSRAGKDSRRRFARGLHPDARHGKAAKLEGSWRIADQTFLEEEVEEGA